jgi:hypothetical protein
MLPAADLSLPAVTKVHLKMMLSASLGLTACATKPLQACQAAATVEHHHRLLHKGADAPVEMWLWPDKVTLLFRGIQTTTSPRTQLDYNS